jgi:hypothetical protein
MTCKGTHLPLWMSSFAIALTLSGAHLHAANPSSAKPSVAQKTADAQSSSPHWTTNVVDKKTKIEKSKEVAVPAADANTEIKRVSKNIQELKRQVIDLNKELRLMEEKLLFPSSTKYTVFVSLSSGQFFTLDGVKLKIDEKMVASHIYSEKQRQALIRGGVQKLYITNLNEGAHSATLFFTGVGPNGRDYKRASTIDFEKGPAGEYLEVAISDDSVAQEPVFGIKQW